MPNPTLPAQPEQFADAFVSAFSSGDLGTTNNSSEAAQDVRGAVIPAYGSL